MSRRARAAGTFLLLAATALAYLPAFRAGFIWDDPVYVAENHTLRSLDGLRQIWLVPGAVIQYYPLVFTTFWIEYHLWGLNPAGYHAVNVALHGLNAILVWLLLRRLEVRWAWVAAAIFALHPVHVESVAWITERKNTLSTLFYLLSLRAYLGFRPLQTGGPHAGGNRSFYALAVAAFAAALLSKTVACSLPAAILLLTWWKRGRIGWRDILPLLPFFVLGLGLSLVTISMEAEHVGAEGPEWNLSFLDRVLIAGRALWFYLSKLIWPAGLAFTYHRWEIDDRVWWQYLYPAAALAVVLGLWAARRRIGRGALTAALFFAGTLFPALGFISVYPMRYSFVADHFQYLASLGLIVLAVAVVGTGLGRLGPAGRKAAPVLATAVLLALAVGVQRQSRVYHDILTLWRDTVAKSPQSAIANNNLGVELDKRGLSVEAILYLQAAVRLRPNDIKYVNNLANAYGNAGRFDQALEAYSLALRLDPRSARTYYNLGTTCGQMGRDEQAVEQLTQALRINPGIDAARQNLVAPLLRRAEALLADRQPQQAVDLLTETLPYVPQSAAVRVTLCRALGASGQSRRAIACYRECLQRHPDLPEALNGLAWLLATDTDPSVRHGQEAVALAERACELTRYQAPLVLDTLAAALAEAGQFERAVQTASQARTLAERLGATSLAREIDERLQLYTSGTPYRVPVAPASSR